MWLRAFTLNNRIHFNLIHFWITSHTGMRERNDKLLWVSSVFIPILVVGEWTNDDSTRWWCFWHVNICHKQADKTKQRHLCEVCVGLSVVCVVSKRVGVSRLRIAVIRWKITGVDRFRSSDWAPFHMWVWEFRRDNLNKFPSWTHSREWILQFLHCDTSIIVASCPLSRFSSHTMRSHKLSLSRQSVAHHEKSIHLLASPTLRLDVFL